MKRLVEIESAIRDSKQVEIEIQYSHFVNDSHTKGQLKLTFEKFEKENIVLVLIAPTLISLFDDTVEDQYVSHIKAFEIDGSFAISFDPYDERIGEIEDRDNYVFKSKEYEITRTEVQ